MGCGANAPVGGKEFARTTHCTSGQHCLTCRALDVHGRNFRGKIQANFSTPERDPSVEDDPTAFACPHGKLWGHTTPPVPGGDDRAAKLPDAAPSRARRRFPGPGTALALLIKWLTLGRLKPCPRCNSKRGALDRLGWRGLWRLRRVLCIFACDYR